MTSTKLRNAKPPANGKPFEPGKSGNPGGMAAWQRQMKALMRDHTEDAVKVVVEVMNSPNAKTKDRLSAAQYIIDQTCGKAVQKIAGDDGDGATVPLEGLTVTFVSAERPVSSET